VCKNSALFFVPAWRWAPCGKAVGLVAAVAAAEAFTCTVFVLGLDLYGANVLVSFLLQKPNM
jgi:hypothetical protein